MNGLMSSFEGAVLNNYLRIYKDIGISELYPEVRRSIADKLGQVVPTDQNKLTTTVDVQIKFSKPELRYLTYFTGHILNICRELNNQELESESLEVLNAVKRLHNVVRQ